MTRLWRAMPMRTLPMRTLPMRAMTTTTAKDRMRSTRPPVTRARRRRSLRLARRRPAWMPTLRPTRHSPHRWSQLLAPRRRRRWEWWPPTRCWLHPHRLLPRMRSWSPPAYSAPRPRVSARAPWPQTRPAPRPQTRRSHWRRTSWWDYCFCRTVSSRRSCAFVRTHRLTARSLARHRHGAHGLSPTAMIICTALDTTALEIWLSTC